MSSVLKGATVVAALRAVPLASAPSRSDRITRVCGGHCGHNERWFPCPSVPPFNIALRKRGPLPYKASAPDQGADRIGFPIPEITFLTFSLLISISHLNSIIHLFINQCIGHTAS
jgi:hypothetical protein